MKVSILLPTHNRCDVIGLAIRSALGQTLTDWEMLVVGDGCTDQTSQVVASFADPRIRWFDLPKGPGFGYANRNVALREATGEFVAFLAHDDLWLVDHLEKMIHVLETAGADFGYSRPLWVEPGGRIFPGDFHMDDPHFKLRVNSVPASCVVHRRDCFERVGYWNEEIVREADLDMWQRILSASSQPAAFYPHPTCVHFRANWRKQSNVTSRLLKLPEIHARFPVLQLPPPPEEQGILWRETELDPAGWLAAVRSAVEESDRLVAEMDRGVIDAFENAPVHLLALGPYTVRAENNDPQFLLPPCDLKKCEKVIVRVEITCPVGTIFQIFFSTIEDPVFSERQTLRQDLVEGQNIFHLVLPQARLRDVLRIDPGCHPGEYIIHTLGVRGWLAAAV